MRPILSMVGAYNHGLATYLGKLFSGLRDSKNICKDSFSLAKFLGQSNLHDAYFVSYDVESLFTNVPVNEVIEYVQKTLYPPDTSRKEYKYANFKYLDMKRAPEFCLKDNTFTFNGKLFVKVDGLAMGSPLAPILADIFLNSIFDPLITHYDTSGLRFGTYEPRFFTRYVDDILVALKDENTANSFKLYLETLHPNIRFKIEYELFDKIPFLDIWILKDFDKLSTAVYRKPTHSGVYIHYLSYVPFKHKVSLLKGLLYRAYNLCSDWELLHRELESLTAMLTNCGYNKDLIYRFINNFLKAHIIPDIRDSNSSQQDTISNVKPKVVFLNLPYLEDTTSKVRNAILGFIKRYDLLGTKLKIIILYKCCTVGQFFHIKGKIPLDMRANVIYKITCSCGQMYIGETRRNVYTRMAEHAKTSGTNITAVGQHLADNPGHSANTANPDVLASSRYNFKRKI